MSEAKSWEQHYRSSPTNVLPWHSGAPDAELIELVKTATVRACRTLDVGSGQGTEAVFLALAGFDVTGLDHSPTAVKKAKKLAALLGAKVNFRVGSVLKMPFRTGQFAFVTDRGCLHSLPNEQWPGWVAEVRRVLKPGGRLFVRTFSDRANPNYGPHCFPRAELRRTLSPPFRIDRMRRCDVLGSGGLPTTPLWEVLATRR